MRIKSSYIEVEQFEPQVDRATHLMNSSLWEVFFFVLCTWRVTVLPGATMYRNKACGAF